MRKLLVIGGSTHSESINRSFARYVGSRIPNSELIDLDLNDFEMPIYSEDREEAWGIPDAAKQFLGEIQASDGIILSLAEHNGSYSSAFKNILDWTSRYERKLWSEKPMLLLATSSGGRGGANVLAASNSYFPHLGAKIVSTFSLPLFHENYSISDGIVNPELNSEIEKMIEEFSNCHAI